VEPPDTRSTWRRRLRAFWGANVRRPFEDYRWLLLFLLAVATVILGSIGIHEYSDLNDLDLSPSDQLYATLQLFTTLSSAEPPLPGTLDVARWMAWLVTLGATVGALLALLHDRVGRLRVLTVRNHVLICGLGRIGLRLAIGFRDRGYRVVVIEPDLTKPGVEACRREGIIVLPGDATEADVLRRMGLKKARYLIAACGDDGLNVAAIMSAHDLVDPAQARPLECFVHIVDPHVRRFLTEFALQAWKPAFRLRPFNASELGAPNLLVRHPPFDEAGRIGSGDPHVVVVGLGQTGGRLVIGLARLWAATGSPGRLAVTVVDRQAGAATAAMHRDEPRLAELVDLRPWDVDVDTPAFSEPSGGAVDMAATTVAYVCLDEELRGLRTALILRRVMRDVGAPIIVRTTERSTLTTFPEGLESAQVNVHVFNLLDRACTPEVVLEGTVELLAKAIHEDYVRKQTTKGETARTNPSLSDWNDLPEVLKRSNRDQAADVGHKLDRIGCDLRRVADLGSAEPFAFTPDEVEFMARAEHERWMRERRAEGFTFGSVKDLAAKRHPDLVPWEDLTEETRQKDRDTVLGMPAFLARAGFAIDRRAR
jgi:hypothetical protein